VSMLITSIDATLNNFDELKNIEKPLYITDISSV